MNEKLSDNQAVRKAWNYSLFDAIFNRRSRRMALGAEIPGGPHAYKSDKPPLPLDEVEEALLVQAGTGISGLNLSDLPFKDDQGRTASGNTMMQFTGRTWASPCGSHGTELFYWNDGGAWLVKLKDVCGDKMREYETEDDRDAILESFRANRVKVTDKRPEHPRAFPAMLPFNFWDSNVEGSTIFLPVINHTWQFINALLLVCGWADGGAYIIDDWAGKPAGCERWIGEGLLDGNRGLPMSTLTGGQEVEPALIMQNIVLAEQAMGLGGWLHAGVAAPFLFGPLGFQTITPKNNVFPVPVGIDGVLEGYCPPYFKDMNAAVDAVVEEKFGSNGLYQRDTDKPRPFLNASEFVQDVPTYSDKLVQCVKDICTYMYETYGRFPPHLPTMDMSAYWVQAHHLDLDFYDKFYPAGAYTETQAEHMELWHASAAAPARERELAGTTA